MSAIEVPDPRTRTVRFRWISVTGALVAAALFLGSAVLQLVASLQRWVVFRNSPEGDNFAAEDHLYDYFFPWEPWVPIGTAAELLGAGLLLLAVGVVVMPFGVLSRAPAPKRRAVAVGLFSVELLLAVAVAVWFGAFGAHALQSGLTGTPSALRGLWPLSWIGLAGLVALSALWLRRSRASTVASACLIGATAQGYLIATYVIAPLIGGVSHDTAPWSETVVAASTGAAGVAMLVVAGAAARRREPHAA